MQQYARCRLSLQRLKQVLGSDFTADVRSDQATVDKVAALALARKRSLEANQKPVPATKPPQIVASLAEVPTLSFKAVDVLRKIGELTTPQWANLAQLSSSWATRRYFWAISPATYTPARFKLNPECADLDFHQKTLMSDEFGVGFAGLAMERLFNTDAWVDVSIAIDDPQRFQMLRRASRLQPDFLMWKDQPDQPYYVVECKGSQSGLSVSMDQIRRGLEQVPSLRFGAGRPVHRLVVATLLQGSSTTLFVIDPEDEETDEERARRKAAETSERISEKVNDNAWFIPNEERFENRVTDARSIQLLNWAGQYRSAAAIEAQADDTPEHRIQLEDRPVTQFRNEDLIFEGYTVPFYPELLGSGVNLFVGVEQETLEVARRARPLLRTTLRDRTEGLQAGQQRGGNLVSVGLSGTCLAIEGLKP